MLRKTPGWLTQSLHGCCFKTRMAITVVAQSITLVCSELIEIPNYEWSSAPEFFAKTINNSIISK